jgi:NAD(P)-dependent dehydrogenase (short-subunit alcohol dehydrogenase family)
MLVGEGLAVTAVARNADKLSEAAERLRDQGGDVRGFAADLSEERGVKAAVAAHRENFGRLDVLVNNAGVLLRGRLEEIEADQVDRQLALNLRSIISFYSLSRELLLAAGKDHGNAVVVNLASSAGKSGESTLGAYAATKFGVIGFTESMNCELAKHGVKSCAICPAFVDTPMTDFAKDTVAREEMIQPADIAVMVRPLLHLSPAAIVPEIILSRPGSLVGA